MKKITLFLLLPLVAWSQSKISNTVSVSNVSATILLNSNTQVATLTIVGPSDRWFACQFGQFSGGMEMGSDVVYYDGTVLVDASQGGIGVTPTPDSQNNWTVIQNTVNSGARTIVATRAFNSPDAADYDFVYSNTTIGIAVAHGSSASYSLAYHGADNRTVDTAVTFTTLGVEDFSLNNAQVYPNPAKGIFLIKTTTGLERINIYTQTGAFVKSIPVTNFENTIEVTTSEFQSGVYLLELVNNTEKVWKKIILQ